MTASVFSILSMLLLGSISLPQLVVPNSRDLKIKVKRTSSDSSATVESLYLKGARQRVEYSTERTIMGGVARNDFVEPGTAVLGIPSSFGTKLVPVA